MRYDAVIVGAGPAGSAAARLLAQVGWRIALVEKMEFPRRKVCGEFISATTMPVLKACGVAAPFIAAAGPQVMRIGAYAGNSMFEAPGGKLWGRALGREHLDVMLRDAAIDAGATLLQPAEVAQLLRENDKLSAERESLLIEHRAAQRELARLEGNRTSRRKAARAARRGERS